MKKIVIKELKRSSKKGLIIPPLSKYWFDKVEIKNWNPDEDIVLEIKR